MFHRAAVYQSRSLRDIDLERQDMPLHSTRKKAALQETDRKKTITSLLFDQFTMQNKVKFLSL